SELTSNSAERAGGAVEANGGSTIFREAEVVSNSTGSAPGNGGGFHLTGSGDVQIINSQFTANTAAAEGGAVWNSDSGTMKIRGSTFTNNNATGTEADEGGGAVFNDGGIVRINR